MEASLLGLILVPLSFGYAITKHRLTDVKLIFREGAAYVLASSALLGSGLLLNFLNNRMKVSLISEPDLFVNRIVRRTSLLDCR